ncbi:DUF4291 domain-containing protein [Actinokineospora guangxiensis]|uniref:DUF4291 domain-containing protein n=1 Tax=Actinokineospora guangxiensis TaxID=1490288 RepID=A0ABW0EHM5_9PSEU
MEKYRVRAVHDERTITVYQAYPPAIADAALAAGTFVPPFKRERMTWIKPSFLWMMYRSGYARKPDQERVLAVRITREGFAWALANSCASTPGELPQEEWRRTLRTTPVRTQWDPERGLRHEALAHRSLQVGLSGEAVARYVDEWIVDLTDVTPLAHTIGAAVAAGDLDTARAALPAEHPYPLPE